MSEKAKEARREYAKKWRRDNPEKVKAIQNRYWEKKAKELETLNKEIRKKQK
jgi:hypothetical protein